MSFQDDMVEALKLSPEGLEFEAKVTIVPSESDPRDFHCILELGKFYADPGEQEPTFVSDGPPVCIKCKGFRYRDTCQHVRSLTAETQKRNPKI